MRRFLFLLAGISLGYALTAVARDGEESVAITALPGAVKSAIKAQFESAKLLKASKETEDGKMTFEVGLEFEGQSIEVELDADGAILEIERELAAADLPKSAMKALRTRYPDARISEVVAIQTQVGGPFKYEVRLTSEVTVSADGIVEEQMKEDGEDEHRGGAEDCEHDDEDGEDDD